MIAATARRPNRCFLCASDSSYRLLFLGFNLYSFYMAAGDIHNTVVTFHPAGGGGFNAAKAEQIKVSLERHSA